MKHENGASVSDYCGMMWRVSCKNKTLEIGMFLFPYLENQWSWKSVPRTYISAQNIWKMKRYPEAVA